MTYDITKKIKQRDYNMELLRLVNMCMIVFLHLDIFLLKEPQFFNFDSASYYRILFNKSLTIISVNVFIMLSGWYGIKMKWERFIFFTCKNYEADNILNIFFNYNYYLYTNIYNIHSIGHMSS